MVIRILLTSTIPYYNRTQTSILAPVKEELTLPNNQEAFCLNYKIQRARQMINHLISKIKIYIGTQMIRDSKKCRENKDNCILHDCLAMNLFLKVKMLHRHPTKTKSCFK